MIGRPRLGDVRLVLSFAGETTVGVALLELIPLATSLVAGEPSAAVDFLLGLGAALAAGLALMALGRTEERPAWIHGMAAAALSWILAALAAAIPYWLSGHYGSFLDAAFDAMSGFTTTGLVLMADLDHASIGLNMWRHVVTFAGGQGMVVLALALFLRAPGAGYPLYVGEGKDERLYPSVRHTARQIWRISMVYLAAAAGSLFAAGLAIGLGPVNAFLHGLWMAMSAWSTGGFAPMSQSVLYYHSGLYEGITLAVFALGSMNFALHNAVFRGERREPAKNLEARTFATTLAGLAALACIALSRSGAYSGPASILRKGFYLLASGHTTTGLMNVYARQFALDWGNPALIAMIVAMMLGGSACSTAGGFKALRVGLVWKGLIREISRVLAPASAAVEQRYWYHGPRLLDDGQLRSALLIVVLYCGTLAAAALANAIAGYPFLESVFEAASVTGNVGLSIGVTAPSMPDWLKAVYILVMWAGRLEFTAVFAGLGFVVAMFGRPR